MQKVNSCNLKTTYEYDKLGRVVRIITTESQRKQKRNEDPGKVKETKKALGFQDLEEYSHNIALNSGGVDEDWNVSRMTPECNRIDFRRQEKNYEKIRKKIGPQEKITREIKTHYEHTVSDLSRMNIQKDNPEFYLPKGYQYDFYTGTPRKRTNEYKSGLIPNWNGQNMNKFLRTAKRSKITGKVDLRTLKGIDGRREQSNKPSVKGTLFKKILSENNK